MFFLCWNCNKEEWYKLGFIVQANFTWMEIVRLRKKCKLCFKIHYVKVFRSFLSSFFWKRRKKANQRKKKKQVRPFPENSLKKHERILGTGDCRECSRKCVFSFKFENNGWKSPKSLLCLQKKWSEKPSRPKRAEGGQASACRQTKGIFCESRIFGVIPGYVRTNITVSSGGLI